MKLPIIRKRHLAIAAGIGLLTAGSAVAYWRHSQRAWCVQFASNSGQEVTYSRGCLSPHRYKQWPLTVSVPTPSHRL